MGLRILIEGDALRRAIRRGDDAWEAEIVAAFHALDLLSARIDAAPAPPSEEELAALESRHHDFHRALLQACASPRLTELFHRLYAETQRYRLPGLGGAPRTRRHVSQEHREIMEATLARREDEAVALLSAHYRRTAEAFAGTDAAAG